MSADTADAADTVIEVVDLAGGDPYPFGQGLEQQRSATTVEPKPLLRFWRISNTESIDSSRMDNVSTPIAFLCVHMDNAHPGMCCI